MPSQMDDHDFPIVRLRAFGKSTDDDIRARLAFLDDQLARCERGALIFDTRDAVPIWAAHRRMWSEWLTRNEPRIRQHVAGAAILTGSAAMRGVFNVILWAWKPPIPVVFVGTLEEAERVVRIQLAAVG